MGNHFSSQGWKRKQRHKCQENEVNSDEEYEAQLEIEELCFEACDEVCNEEEEEEINSTPRYQNKNSNCYKASKHTDYIPFENLDLCHLPEAIRHPSLLDYILARGNMVVFIRVEKKSASRDDTKYGHCASGYACVCDDEILESDCRRVDCKFGNGQNHKVYGGILVTTNRHVITDDFEYENSEFDFFFENTRSSIVKGFGYSLRDDIANKDYVGVKIYFHDASMVEKIRKFSSEAVLAWQNVPTDLQVEFEQHTVVISHPHHWPKQVSFGKLLEKERTIPPEEEEDKIKKGVVNSSSSNDGINGNNNNHKKNSNNNYKKNYTRVSKYTSMTCTGSSGSPVLTGCYWNNPFVHSTGCQLTNNNKRVDKNVGGVDVDGGGKKHYFWGESYFY